LIDSEGDEVLEIMEDMGVGEDEIVVSVVFEVEGSTA